MVRTYLVKETDKKMIAVENGDRLLKDFRWQGKMILEDGYGV